MNHESLSHDNHELLVDWRKLDKQSDRSEPCQFGQEKWEMEVLSGEGRCIRWSELGVIMRN